MPPSNNRRTTLKDIAREANCSVAVASTVLNRSRGNTVVSEETRKRINDIAEKLNYRPNFASRSLKLNASRTLGIYVQNGHWRYLSNAYEMEIFKGVERAVHARQYELLLLSIGCDAVPEVCAHKLAEHRIDGVVLLHIDSGTSWVKRLLEVSSNVIAIDYNVENPELDAVRFDNRAAVAMAIGHLRQLGHRRIGFIGSALEMPTVDNLQREAAFLAGIGEFSLQADERYLFNRACCREAIESDALYCQLEGEQGMAYLLALPEPPTAVIAYNSLVAVNALRYAKKRGVSVPRHLSIIGIDNNDLCLYTDPELTVIDHPLAEMGYTGTLHLIDKIEQNLIESFHPKYLPELIQRHSTDVKH